MTIATRPLIEAPRRALHQSRYAPADAALTGEQYRFMHLHSRTYDSVMSWRLVLGATHCRARTDGGQIATLHIDALAELVASGLMRMVGDFGADLTSEGLRCLI